MNPKNKHSVKYSTKVTPADVSRKQRLICLMSEEEMRIVNRYLAKYKIPSKSRWMREVLLSYIHRKLEDDYPTLFGEHDMRR